MKRQKGIAASAELTEVDAFAKIASTLDDLTDLARPALVLAADEYPGLNVQSYLNKLDDLADEALQSVVIGARTDCEAARRLSQFLAQDRKFHGDSESYYDPKNSYLNDVLDRRTGIPITLSLVLIEVGRRLGMPLVGIGFPGHFLVGCGPHRRNEYLLLDPFSGGEVVDWHECELRLQAMGIQFDPEAHLSPVTNRQFFERILNNLRAIYIRQRDIPRATRTIARLVTLDATHSDDYLRLAAQLMKEGVDDGARQSLRCYLDLGTDDESSAEAREMLEHLLEKRALRN